MYIVDYHILLYIFKLERGFSFNKRFYINFFDFFTFEVPSYFLILTLLQIRDKAFKHSIFILEYL